LADCYNELGFWGYQQPNEAFPKAKNAALEALKLDDTLAEAHTSLAWVLFFYDRDWERVENEFKQAIKLNPNYATAHHWYSVFLYSTGRYDESIDKIKRAQELDPRSIKINSDVGWPYYFMRQYDQAIEEFQNALLIDEAFWQTHRGLALCYLEKEMYEEALAETQQAKDLHKGRDLRIEVLIGISYTRIGQREEAEQVLKSLLKRSEQEYVPPMVFADLHFALKQDDQGFDWLKRALEVRDPFLVWLRTSPFYDSIRSDPRFIEVMEKIGLDKYWIDN